MFGNLFKKSAPTGSDEQAVLLHLCGEDFDRMVALSDRLETAIREASVGEFDGNEIGGGETTLFMYGSDAEKLFAVIEPVLRSTPEINGARVVIRAGKPGAAQRIVTY